MPKIDEFLSYSREHIHVASYRELIIFKSIMWYKYLDNTV